MNVMRPLRSRRSSIFFGTALLISAIGLTACGFRPLHGQPGQNAARTQANNVAGTMAYIQIRPIENRNGQILRNYLLDRITPRGEPSTPHYRLTVTLTETETSVALNRDASETRTKVIIVADYKLEAINSSPEKVILSGKEEASSAYSRRDTTQYAYADSAAKRHSAERSLEIISEAITRRIGLYFRKG